MSADDGMTSSYAAEPWPKTGRDPTVPKAPSSTVASAPVVVSLKVSLQGSKPPIWRRVLVSGTTTLERLHGIIQVAMGWTDSHLHAFTIGDRQYGDPRQLDGAAREKGVTLNRIIASGVTRFLYTYDFGDSWDHVLTIEKMMQETEGLTLPSCTAGRRRCPPEDCGGIWGYANLLEILADPAHPDHAHQREWVGDALDPEAFDVKQANAELAAAFSRGRRGVWQKV